MDFKPKVVILVRLYAPHLGGVEKHVQQTIKFSYNHFSKMTILTEKFSSIIPSFEKKSKKVFIYRIKYPKIKFVGLLIIWFEIFKKIKLLYEADVIHIHDVFVWYLPFRFIFFNKKVFCTLHGWEGEYPVPFVSILQKRIATYFSKVTFIVGSFQVKYYGLISNSIEILFGGVTENKIIKRKYRKKSIVYVGRLEADTGLPILLKAFQKLKKHHFNIIFCGNGSLKSECEKYGKVMGYVNPINYIFNAEYCFCSGYLTILESFIAKRKVVVAYGNALKRDYYLNTPFKNWIISGSSPLNLYKKILKGNFLSEEKINKSYMWAKKHTWKDLSCKYLNEWTR